ncbi:Cell wall-associated hydrolase, NlpC family [Nocardioides scoriae]|uniref:Cell wall-associated hydrolase, NlpC family n=1 Tax=Nocardioides scoriae TaxID=642780 RepID=A0A1H1S710_9ACTN|nr:transglycosylase SLT domain-containing protein [Nocardioides scoriae]SDS43693.1 Cell wall-associated hydrolase, NlpC family [Nocardioides scoriae]
MTVTGVTGRIAELQAALAKLAAPGAAPTSGTDFAQSLSSAVAAATATDGTDPLTAGATVGAAGVTPSTSVAVPGVPVTGSKGSGVTGADVVTEASKYIGLPYVWGGTSPTKGMDCSGLVQVVYKNLGFDLPRVSYQQAAAGRPVASMAQAKPGDLIAWDNSSRNNGVDHIAIYIGGGKMIEAPRTGLDIRLVDVPSKPDVIRRILPEAGAASAGRASTVSATTGAGGAAQGPYADLFNRVGTKYGVSPALLSAVAKAESNYDPRAVSPAGAQGLMQLMPGTARGLGVANSFDPAQAVDGAARMLRDLIHRFGRTDLALAGYNAGPGAVMKYHGIPPYQETQNYVRKIMTSLGRAA